VVLETQRRFIMSATKISGAILVLLAVYIVTGAAFLPAPPAGSEGSEPLLSALGLAWFFAVWGALVASMVFTIAWTSVGVVATERARDRRRIQHGTPAADIEAEDERVLALAS